ncbi:hypothetical protein [Streptomyces yaizuensis]|uniref:Lipoprotein n=1 Tax=Streptomyces yaizuensis TaxID=2989713 RepID=A0ABQ5PA22_9ACTN|nr:hypothetical protein [Streptomyces sp. YSPA8]GLF99436.1 hypothetical protein SYYSPA8_34085 [Streptomyces sp. YSPA8]
MTLHTTARRAARLRLAALVAVPLLAFSAACGDGEGARADRSDEVASVPDDSPRTEAPAKDSGGAREPAAGGKGAFHDAQMTYVRCMRTKGGVKDFPDPKLSGHLDQARIGEIIDPKNGGVEYKGGKDGVCFPEMEKAMNLAPKRDVQKDYESLLAHAKCMRDNGVSKFTNPTMSGGNVIPGGDPSPGSPALDPNAPAYQQAEKACASKLLDGLDGMQ